MHEQLYLLTIYCVQSVPVRIDCNKNVQHMATANDVVTIYASLQKELHLQGVDMEQIYLLAICCVQSVHVLKDCN